MSRHLALLAACFLVLPATMLVAQQHSSWKKLSAPEGQVAALAVGPGGHVYAHIGSLTYRSTDHGATWTPGGEIPGDVTVFRVDPAGTLWGGTFSGLHRSTDEGATWGPAGSSVGHVWDIAFNTKGHIFLGTEDHYLLHSTDNGTTWKVRSGSGMGVAVWSVAVDAEDRVFAGCQGEGIFRSTNNGVAWSRVLPGYIIYGLASARNGDLFAGVSDSGVFRSTDRGATWMKTPLVEQSGLPAVTSGRNIIFNDAGHLFASGFSFGSEGAVNAVYRSTDGGSNWSPFGDRFGAQDFIVAMDIDRSGRVYIATPKGIYSASDGVSSVDAVSAPTPLLRLVGESPIRDRALFALTLPVRHAALLRIVDVAGREVARPWEGGLEAGERLIEWDATGVGPGVYLCQLVIDDAVRTMKVLVVH